MSVEQEATLIEQIGNILTSDPVCNGRVTSGSVEGIAALLRSSASPPAPADVERVAQALMFHFDIDPDVFVRMHGGYGHWTDAAKAALAAIPANASSSSASRDEVLEEGAKVAQMWRSSLQPGNELRFLGHKEAARDIAAAIRDLKSAPGEQSG